MHKQSECQMSKLDFLDEEKEPRAGQRPGAIRLHRPSEAVEGGFAGASFVAMGKEGARHTFDRMRKMWAGSEIQEPTEDHTILAVRDSGFAQLPKHAQASMDVETEDGKAVAQTMLEQHILGGYVSDEFLNGEEIDPSTKRVVRERIFPTAAEGMYAQILPSRVPGSEAPLVRLFVAEADGDHLVAEASVRKTYQSPDDKYGVQQVLVIDKPLAIFEEPDA